MKRKFASMNWDATICFETPHFTVELKGKMHELTFILFELFGIKELSNYI